MKCDHCNSQKITYYRQIRKDGVTVVTARCENGHSPKKGQPFYSIKGFDLKTLDLLPDGSSPVVQLSLEEKLRKDYKEEIPIPKYPKMPTAKPNDRNILIPIEDK